jgi:membrane-associated phospholipid phosphatase
MAALSSILALFNKRLSIAFWTLTLLVGIGRIYVGVHHSIDIIGSIVIAYVVTAIVFRFLRRKNSI